jgi:uncharacterized protein
MTVEPDPLDVVLVFSLAPRKVLEFHFQITPGSTVAQALAHWRSTAAASQWAEATKSLHYGVWGKAAKVGQVLKAHDRIELYRPLTVDPKTARRQRFVRQGSKGAGLFAGRRSGGKAGY